MMSTYHATAMNIIAACVVVILVLFPGREEQQHSSNRSSSCHAFTVQQQLDLQPLPPQQNYHAGLPKHRQNRKQLQHIVRLHNTVSLEQEQSNEQLTISKNKIYDLLGIEEGQLALGVKPEEVYKYIGTREDLITKTLNDIPTLTREMAEKEVDQFLLDCEMVNMYIQYGKEVERDPNFVVPDNDNDSDRGWFTPQTIVFGYVGYVGVTSIPQMVRRYVAEQQVDGTWTPTNIPFFDQWIDRTSDDAIARVLQRAADKAAKIAATESAVTTTTTTSEMVKTPSADVGAAVVDVASSILPDPTISASAMSDNMDTIMTTMTSSAPDALQAVLDTVSVTTP